MSNRRQHPVAVFVVAALVCATAGVPTPRPTELVACPYLSFCLPRAACLSSKVTFDAKYSSDFACGVLMQSSGHVCCAVSSGGFLPSALNWLPNTPPSAPAVTPWLGFQPNTANEDGYLPVKSLSKTEFPNVSSAIVETRSFTGFKAIVLHAEAIEETDFRSGQQNTKGWSCGEVLSSSALNETYTAEERLINQGDYPWQVAVLTVDMRYMCGGALVGSGNVLTLASCIRNVAGDQLLIRIGDQDLSSNREPLPAFDVPVNGIALHPAFDPSSRQFDLAVLQLQHSVSSLSYVRGACLPLSNLNLPTTQLDRQLSEQFGQLFLSNLAVASDQTHCHLASWGLEAEEQGSDGSFSYILRGGQSYVLSREVCQAILGRNESLSTYERCAAGYGGTAICRGGGGSALVCRAGDRFVLEGIIARSSWCSRNTPLVYIKVDDHLNFILDHLKLQSTRKEAIMQPDTSKRFQGSIFNSNEKTDGVPSENTLGTFNLLEHSYNINSVNPTRNLAISHDSRKDVLEGFSKDGNPSLINGSPLQSNGGGRMPFESPGRNLLQIPPTGIPAIGYSTVNNIGNGKQTNENVRANFAQSSLFQFGDVIVPGGSGQQKQSGSSIANNLIENKDIGLNSAHTSTNGQEIHKDLSEIDTIPIGSDESDEAIFPGQGGGISVPDEILTPHTGERQKFNSSGLSDGISAQTEDDIQNIFIDNGEISIPKGDVDPPTSTVDLNEDDFINGVPKRDDYLLDLDHNSDKRDGFISESLSDLGDNNFRPSIIKSPATAEPSFDSQKVSGSRFIGSFIDDSQVNLPHSQFAGRTEFHDWRPSHFQNPSIPFRGFHEYNPIKVPPFAHGRESHWRRDPFSFPLRPYRGYHPIPSLFHRPQPPPPPPFQPSIGPRHPNKVLFQQSYTPIYTLDHLPNPPPFFDGVPDTPTQLGKMSSSGRITLNQTPPSLQPDTTKSDVSEMQGNGKSDPYLQRVQEYLSRYQ